MNDKILSIIVKAQDRASNTLRGIQGRLEKMRPAFEQMAMIGTASLAAIGLGIGKAVEAAGRAEEIETRFAATFDKTEDRMRKFVARFSRQWNRATSDIKAMSATLGGTLRAGTDLAEKKISNLAKETILAAEGMAAFDERIKDGSQAMDAMAKAMVGNTGTLQDWGFDVSKETQVAKALEMGLIDTKDQFDKNTRAIAVQKLIMEQTRGPVEALRKSEGNYAETKRRLNARITEVSENLGKVFLPIVNDVLEKVSPVVEKVSEWIEKNPELAKKIVIATAAISAMVAATGALGLVLLGINSTSIAVAGAIAAIGTAVYILIRNNKDTIDGLAQAFQRVKDKSTQFAEVLKKEVLPEFEKLMNKVSDFWNKNKDWLIPTLETLGVVLGVVVVNALKLAAKKSQFVIDKFQGISDKVKWVADKLSDFKDAAVDALKTVIKWLNKVPGVNIPINGPSLKTVQDRVNGIQWWLDKNQPSLNVKFKGGGSMQIPGGGGFADGGFTGRGGTNDVAGVVHKGEYVIPKKFVNQDTGTPNVGSTFNMYGNINLGSQDAVDRFFDRLNAQQEMGSLGVGV